MKKKTILYFIFFLSLIFIIEFISFFSVNIYRYFNNVTNITFKQVNDIDGTKEYSAFVGWRGYYSNNLYKTRKSLENPNWNKKNKIFFFGGSTMLGHGVEYINSIPSLSAKLDHHFNPVNMGEHSYVSGQSLNRLIKISDDIKSGDIVVFYDGTNDVVNNCNTNNGPAGHGRVYQIRNLIENQSNYLYLIKNDFSKLFYDSNTFILINGISKKFFPLNSKDNKELELNGCDEKSYANAVAQNLIRNWNMANLITKSKGAKFYAFLQPSPYTANFKINQPIRKFWKLSYDEVYPLIRKIGSKYYYFKDLSSVLDKDYFTDWCCHLNSEGNKFIAQEILNTIKSKN